MLANTCNRPVTFDSTKSSQCKAHAAVYRPYFTRTGYFYDSDRQLSVALLSCDDGIKIGRLHPSPVRLSRAAARIKSIETRCRKTCSAQAADFEIGDYRTMRISDRLEACQNSARTYQCNKYVLDMAPTQRAHNKVNPSHFSLTQFCINQTWLRTDTV
jgi:hypothetical protein